jgi:hypothetical protein
LRLRGPFQRKRYPLKIIYNGYHLENYMKKNFYNTKLSQKK